MCVLAQVYLRFLQRTFETAWSAHKQLLLIIVTITPGFADYLFPDITLASAGILGSLAMTGMAAHSKEIRISLLVRVKAYKDAVVTKTCSPSNEVAQAPSIGNYSLTYLVSESCERQKSQN